eukprot:TRINITY_DN11086_c0_g1_i1.p2 TRINITY_DN11086_c0_g1~~TRINITY_DN11086_c0_g1_i1.p2  ORF type:complete len:119 (-),score=15.81 TRINITY_DN11086_c0_g1_i1:196-552(-)
MGITLGVFDWTLKIEKTKVVMLGLDAAGKSTVHHKLLRKADPPSAPTIGFNIQTAEVNNLTFYVWDICGSDRIRPLWKPLLEDAQALVFVVDSCDRERVERAKEEFYKLLQEQELRVR